MSSIANYYSDKSILITGATGFLGKVLLEKLLRSCHELKCVYVLIRVWRDKSPISRLADLLNSQAFDRLRHENPEALKKVVLISGDMTKPGLDLSSKDIELLNNEISIVFNLAARLKFDDQLKEAIDSNIKGPLELLRISREFKKLKVFVHVSTAYCHFNDKLMDETIPKAPYDVMKLVDFVESMNNDEYNLFAKQLVSKYPNVYAYTKGLAEQLLEKESLNHSLPLVIVKPSTILASMHDPYPGWIDTLNGTNGLTAGIGKGLTQVCRLDSSVFNDVVPVDFTANITIAAAWNHGTNKAEVEVYNFCSGPANPVTFGQSIDYAVENWRETPLKDTLWYPSCVCYRYWLPCFFSLIINHYIPAIFIDILSQITGKKVFLVKLYKKLDKLMGVMTPYTLVNWNFKAEKQIILYNKMSGADRATFDFDTSKIDWKQYSKLYCLGIRRFVFKDDIGTVNRARKLLKRKYVLQLLSRIFFYFFIVGWTLYSLNIETITSSPLFYWQKSV